MSSACSNSKTMEPDAYWDPKKVLDPVKVSVGVIRCDGGFSIGLQLSDEDGEAVRIALSKDKAKDIAEILTKMADELKSYSGKDMYIIED